MHMLTAMYFSRASSSTSGRKLVAPHPHPDCPFICLTMSSSFFIYHKINIQCIHSVKRTHTLPFILYYKIGFCRASIFVLCACKGCLACLICGLLWVIITPVANVFLFCHYSHK